MAINTTKVVINHKGTRMVFLWFIIAVVLRCLFVRGAGDCVGVVFIIGGVGISLLG